MQDTEDWDDLQAAESEACGVLADMFGQDIPNDGGCNVVHDVTLIEDSPQPEKNQTFLEVDSSTDSEDEDDIFGSKIGRNPQAIFLTKAVPKAIHPLNFWPDDLCNPWYASPMDIDNTAKPLKSACHCSFLL
ncbi:ATP-dependent DNA helicase Q-like 1 [Syzygium oleosum]|uniref:ATP-dependent DNA helicase Q-like 1 n=1 Tax=Syzygium oleosum TaxID=219896 RepID=UPI0024BA1468|nr:ATP-dependent DNA helicase Q-like 1 [Syzygium oleosum]